MNTETLHFKFLKVFCCVLLLQLGWSHALGAVTEANQSGRNLTWRKCIGKGYIHWSYLRYRW